MAHRRLIQPARRASKPIFPPLSSCDSKTLIPNSLHQPVIHNLNTLLQQTRGYISEMRKSAVDGNVLRQIRNEIEYELDRYTPTQPVPMFNTFAIDERPGEQFVRLSKRFGDNEEIKVEATMFVGSAPHKKTGGIRTFVTEDDVEHYISMVIDIHKDHESNVLEFDCTVWPDSIEIDNVFMRGEDRIATGQHYIGPPFNDLDDELQTSLYDFLEMRGIDDGLAAFLHKYMQNKRKTEFIRWMGNVKSVIEKQ